jgi:hypothetical protein
VLPSLKVPVAVNCSVNPIEGDVFGAVTLMDCSVGAVTVNAKLLDAIPLCVAVMLLEPIAAPVAKPVALMLTVAGLELVQVAVLLRFCELPSLNVPVAVN